MNNQLKINYTYLMWIHIDESLVTSDSIEFDKLKSLKNLTLFLYPDDSDEAGCTYYVFINNTSW